MKLPVECPSCANKLTVSTLKCPNCETEVKGNYQMPELMRLNPDDQKFIIDFILNSGSLKEMAKILGKSYPSVRNRLDEIIKKLKASENE